MSGRGGQVPSAQGPLEAPENAPGLDFWASRFLRKITNIFLFFFLLNFLWVLDVAATQRGPARHVKAFKHLPPPPVGVPPPTARVEVLGTGSRGDPFFHFNYINNSRKWENVWLFSSVFLRRERKKKTWPHLWPFFSLSWPKVPPMRLNFLIYGLFCVWLLKDRAYQKVSWLNCTSITKLQSKHVQQGQWPLTLLQFILFIFWQQLHKGKWLQKVSRKNDN